MRPVDWLILVPLLLLAAALRLIGIDHGQLKAEYFPSYAPYGMTHELLPIQPDEHYVVALPVYMGLRGSWNPGFYEYPHFIANLNRVVNWLTGALDGLSLDDRRGHNLRVYAAFPLYVMSRMLSVFGGLLMVACAYAIGRMTAGRYAALLAGALVAVSFTLTHHGHIAKPGSLAAGWMMLAAWAGFAALHARRLSSRIWLYILAGIATGLAATTRYNAVSVALIVVPIGLILLRPQATRSMLRTVAAAWLAIPLLFFIGSPYILRDFDAFWRGFSYIVGQFTATGANVPQYFLVDSWTGLLYLMQHIFEFSLGIPAVVCLCLSPLAIWHGRARDKSLWHDSRTLAPLLIWLLLIAYALVALRTIRPGHSDNLLILILPFAAVNCAIGADWLARRIHLPGRWLKPALCLIFIIQPLLLSVTTTKMFSQPDTRQILLDWVHRHIAPGARFFINGPYNLPLDEAIYPNDAMLTGYAEHLPDGAEYDYMIYSDTVAHDILRSDMVAESVKRERREYLRRLDAANKRVAEIQRPVFPGSDAMMNMPAHWYNPTLIMYCLNRQSCAALE